jgi:heme A synthase
MSTEAWLAAGFGGIFVLLLFVTAIWLIATGRQVPETAQWILRVVMALAGAGFGAVLSGILTVDINVPQFAVKATSGFALFVLIYLANPPGRVSQRQKVEHSGSGIQIAGDGNRVKRR